MIINHMFGHVAPPLPEATMRVPVLPSSTREGHAMEGVFAGPLLPPPRDACVDHL